MISTKQMRIGWFWLVLGFVATILMPSVGYAENPICKGKWQKATLTNYTSYPDPGSEECLAYNGCTWAGQFYGLPDQKSRKWVARNNIAAVHSKDWKSLGMKTLRLRQGSNTIDVKVYDLCSDSDCDDCCTKNLGKNKFLIDIEKHTMKRFGSGSGTVEFQICK